MTAVTDPATDGLVEPAVRSRRVRSSRTSALLRTVGPVTLVLLWWAASSTGLLRPEVLASPAQVIRAVGELWGDGEFQAALTTSLRRSGLGLVIGLSLGLVLGVTTGLSRLGDELIDSSVQMLRTVPFLALVPLFLVWFGIGETAKIVLIAFATTFPMYVNATSGVRTVDPRLVEAMRTFGMGRIALIREVILPGALPQLLVGLRLSMTLSVVALIAAEELNATAGIGYLMTQAQNFVRTDILALCIIVYGLFGLAADVIVRTLERLLMPWRRAGARR
ncbi:ABC transporter permease [Kineosporia sp. J2-2]|uniref:ABC transporter permease n=1 Tax=Kineosporia corallincola TaxID=2835133 RepID=A0ABS5TS71_9ACTN|nr:ABC transporter permease [Kineosporia corallincola]MBT0773631.1 ABC transporter permease [Kineosporia corallincola]